MPKVDRDGAAYNLFLSNDEIQNFRTAAVLLPPEIALAAEALLVPIGIANWLGGNNGVNITGIIGIGGGIVTPAAISFYKPMAELAKTIGDFVGFLWDAMVRGAKSDAAVAGLVLGGPIGGALAALVGGLLRNDSCEVFAKGSSIGERERLLLICNGDRIAIQCCTGLLCADAARSEEVWGNGVTAGPEETWELLPDIRDGTVSLRSHKGKYLCVEGNGKLVANRDQVGHWEKFQLVPGPVSGTWGLKSLRTGYFIGAD